MISAFNPEGYDDRQVLHVQQLQINATYSVMLQNDKSGDAWISQDNTSASTDDIGDYFNMVMASKLSIDQVADDATVLVHLFNIEDGTIAKASILASGPTMYARLLGYPQPRMVFAKCIAYSAGVEFQPFPIGISIKFPLPTHIWVAKEFLVNTIDTLGPKVFTDPNTESSRSPKRSCSAAGGGCELADFFRLGMSKFMMNLGGESFSMRDKTDNGAKGKKLFLLFRILEKNRWEYAMGPDYKLQTEEYRNTVIQERRTRGDHKHKAFLTTSFLDIIQGLHLVKKSDVLELLLTGALFVEGGAPTLELTDFAIPNSSEALSTGNTICPYQNRPLVALLRNSRTFCNFSSPNRVWTTLFTIWRELIAPWTHGASCCRLP